MFSIGSIHSDCMAEIEYCLSQWQVWFQINTRFESEARHVRWRSKTSCDNRISDVSENMTNDEVKTWMWSHMKTQGSGRSQLGVVVGGSPTVAEVKTNHTWWNKWIRVCVIRNTLQEHLPQQQQQFHYCCFNRLKSSHHLPQCVHAFKWVIQKF